MGTGESAKVKRLYLLWTVFHDDSHLGGCRKNEARGLRKEGLNVTNYYLQAATIRGMLNLGLFIQVLVPTQMYMLVDDVFEFL